MDILRFLMERMGPQLASGKSKTGFIEPDQDR